MMINRAGWRMWREGMRDEKGVNAEGGTGVSPR